MARTKFKCRSFRWKISSDISPPITYRAVSGGRARTRSSGPDEPFIHSIDADSADQARRWRIRICSSSSSNGGSDRARIGRRISKATRYRRRPICRAVYDPAAIRGVASCIFGRIWSGAFHKYSPGDGTTTPSDWVEVFHVPVDKKWVVWGTFSWLMLDLFGRIASSIGLLHPCLPQSLFISRLIRSENDLHSAEPS